MTREEAIRELIAMKPHIDASMSVMGEVAYDMAIEALKAQLSAKDTTLDDVSTAYENGYQQGKFEALQWISCSERLPEDDTLMLVNYIDERPDAMDIWIGWHEMENVWYIDGEEHSREHGNEVIAWMPLPEPMRLENES